MEERKTWADRVRERRERPVRRERTTENRQGTGRNGFELFKQRREEMLRRRREAAEKKDEE